MPPINVCGAAAARVTPLSKRAGLVAACITTLTLAAALPRFVAAADRPLGPSGARPNILFIFSDDQSYRTMSANEGAYPWVKTPNLDRLAARGVRFRAPYFGTWCMPSRATVLTGKLPFAVESMRMVGDYPGSTYDPAKTPFWPAVFRKQGYTTAQIGKWHTGADAGFGRDWDHQIVWNRPKHVKNAGSYYEDQLLEIDGGEPKVVKGYSTDNYTQYALDYIGGKHRDPKKPWYLWLCYGAPHGPYQPAPRHLAAYADAHPTPPKDILPPREGKPAYVQARDIWEAGPDGQPRLSKKERPADSFDRGREGSTYAAAVREYAQVVLALDEGVGRVLDALEASGQGRNTLVVFASDQGFAYGEHGFRSKLAPYDANIRSPMVVSMPGTLPEGAVVNAPVSGADLVPTFFRFAGLPLPWRMHGRDLSPLLMKPNRPWPYPVLMTHTSRTFGSDTAKLPKDAKKEPEEVPWWVLWRDGRFKYVRTLIEGEIEELYDLEADPEELRNLALEPAHAATVKRMRAAAAADLARKGAPFARSLPPVRPLPVLTRR